ncbi:MAG: hypothetical protein DWQ07_02490 [Chloroflexi bacterium]|nr:MAG: hypothetical protein DWQ07_02490 [Chloroflexota bacterium]MBL1193632.1 hypothetical protein [Chloroflexota bacterium]NOH10924.1 hypothetical protein [Chloroflexota bacterium]
MKQAIDELTLHSYFDDELTAEERHEVEAALASDPALAAQFESLQKLFTKLETAPEVEYQGDVSAQVVANLHPRQSLPTFIRLALVGQAVFAVLVLALAWPFLKLFNSIFTPTLSYELVENTVQDTSLQLSLFWNDFMASLTNLVPQNTDVFAYVPDLALPNTLLLGLAVAATLVWFLGNGVVFTRLIQR